MFLLLRILFVVLLVLWAFFRWKEKSTAELRWQRRRHGVQWVAAGVAVIMAIGLFIERLLS